MRKRTEETLETPITSMIDVVFQLIIFFVVTAAQQKEILDENVLLAQARYTKVAERKDPHAITINVRRDGDVNIAMQTLTLRQLEQVLRAAKAQAGNAEVPVVIRCDGRALYREVDKVVEVVGRAQLYRVRLAAVVKE
jgi:biopolymer transport protein ExbD